MKARVRISSKSKKSGTKIAAVAVRATQDNGNPQGKPIYQTKAQLHARIYTTSNGKPRRD